MPHKRDSSDSLLVFSISAQRTVTGFYFLLTTVKLRNQEPKHFKFLNKMYNHATSVVPIHTDILKTYFVEVSC